MDENSYHIALLIPGYLRGELSPQQQEDLDRWLTAAAVNQALFEQLTTEASLVHELKKYGAYDERRIREKIIQSVPWARGNAAPVPSTPRVRRIGWTRWAAAVLVIALGGGAYFYYNSHFRQIAPPIAAAPHHDVPAPLTSLATITLAGGQQVYLDSAAAGTLATQNNVTIVKHTDGSIAYHGSSAAVAYNTLNNPRGSKVVNITLVDGSQVWLNAGSSITYPTAFIGKERAVTVDGEAYFEVAGSAAQPFRVRKNETEVTVLGTRFNINAYDDESNIRVTLLDGAVRVAKGDASRVLKPGQQAAAGAGIEVLNDVDLDEVMAWKNGEFQFGDKADIGSIMRQLARWYNVEVVYNGNINAHIGGAISRQASISRVLEMLEKTGVVRFRLEGNKVIVIP